MPIKRRALERLELPEEEDLRAELTAELKAPKDSGEPEIIIESPNPGTTHLYVIWSRWGEFDQMVRSRIILDAYTESFGEEEALKVTVAMGLTRTESERLGIG